MSVPRTYPGVYIEEIPSGVRSITGVATSIAAFIGSALRGEENEPTLVQSFAGYTRTFGSLSRNHPMGYAVSQFFLNGGQNALIVRVAQSGVAAASTVTAGTLSLVAASTGLWGDKLSVTITHPDAVINPNAEADGLFSLIITDAGTDSIETFKNISSLPANPRYAPTIVKQQSKLLRIDGPLTAVPRPTEVTAAVFDPTGHDGGPITDADVSTGVDIEANREGIWALEKADLFNLLCIPPYELDAGNIGAATRSAAAAYCLNRRAIFIADPLRAWEEPGDISDSVTGLGGSEWGLSRNANSAVYFPRVIQPDPLQEGRLAELAPCGVIAGIISRTDANRGIWKAPAGLDATLKGVSALSVKLTGGDNGALNRLAVNCLRAFPVKGRVVWGARTLVGAPTLVGADQSASDWKYLPVRRTALYIEESLFRGTQWVVFEPNDEPLWAQIRLSVGSFMQNMFRQGAFQGTSPREAYFVKCDSETTTPTDINNGIVNIHVGFAPQKPAEFVVIKLQQITGQVKA